ncbi:ABC transporter permease [Priestia megaterium]|uniref:ABC transporter permease n=1 Tax=Priestia megaterium TaxID=1404 RepID=UPI001FB37CF0|nr:ABC transporter permease subunit [Priestia megaterium]
MFTICFREFKDLFKSIRSIIVILVIFAVTLGVARLISQFGEQIKAFGLGSNAYAGGLLTLLLIAGPLFVTSLSHNIINQELHSRTIRFLATKTSRNKIVLGKFLGVILFWIVSLLIALLLVVPFSKEFYFPEFIQAVIFISYFVGLTILISTLIIKPSITMFLGIAIALAMPVLGIWSMISENIFLKIASHITPYFYYTQETTSYTYFVIFFPIVFLALSLFIMRKKEL